MNRDRLPVALGRARLVVELEPGGPEELPFPFAVQIVDVEMTRAGELLEQHLRPVSITAVFSVVSLDGDAHPCRRRRAVRAGLRNPPRRGGLDG